MSTRLIIDDGEIPDRSLFGQLVANRFNIPSDLIAVEIGTHEGQYAEQFMEHWSGHLICVDPWLNGYDDEDPASHGDRSEHKKEAQSKLSRFSPRVTFKETTSKTAAEQTQDNSLAFAYIDAKHRYKDILQDLNLWWPKIIKGGIIAGHDIVCPNTPNGGWGAEVQPAVFEFAKSVDRTIYLVRTFNNDPLPWSYYLIK